MFVGLNGMQQTNTDVYLAAFEHRGQCGPNSFTQLNPHVRAAFCITAQKIRKDAVDHLGRSRHLQDAAVGSPQRLSPPAEQVDGTQDDATIAKQLLAVAVRISRRRMRSNSRTPSSASRSPIWRDSAGCAIRNRTAALDTVPCSATVTKVRKWRKFMSVRLCPFGIKY